MKKYRLNETSVLVITDEMVEKLYHYCQKSEEPESGGILVGKIREDHSEILITNMTEPSLSDKSGRFFFVRKKESTQRRLEQIWRSENREALYLGEWHSHPEKYPTPSPTDKNMIDECVKKNEYHFSGLVLLIVGCTGELYVGFKDRKHKLQMLNEGG